MSKDSTGKTLLLLGGGALAAYLLVPKVKEAVQNAIPSITFPPIDISGLMPEGGMDLSGLTAAAGEAAGGAVTDWFNNLFGSTPPEPEPDIPPEEPPPPETEQPSWWDYFKGEAVKVAEFSAGVGLAYVGIRYAAPPIARGVGGIFQRLFGRVGTRATTTAPGQALAGEALGPASATKGFKLKYPKIGPLGAAAFALSGPDLLASIIGLITGQPTEPVSATEVVSQPYKTSTPYAIPVMAPEIYSSRAIPEIIAQNQPAYGMGKPMADWFTSPATKSRTSGGGGGGGGGSSEGGGGTDKADTKEYDPGEYGGIGGTGQWVGGL